MAPRPSVDRIVYPSTCGRGGEALFADDGAFGIDSIVALKPGALGGRSIVGSVSGPDARSGATVSSAADRVVFCGGSVTPGAAAIPSCRSIVPALTAGLPT